MASVPTRHNMSSDQVRKFHGIFRPERLARGLKPITTRKGQYNCLPLLPGFKSSMKESLLAHQVNKNPNMVAKLLTIAGLKFSELNKYPFFKLTTN